LKNFRQGKDLKRTERKYNDKAGIIFLFSLISVVFFMDIYIELSRINLTSDSESKIEISSYSSNIFNNLLNNTLKIYNVHSMIVIYLIRYYMDHYCFSFFIGLNPKTPKPITSRDPLFTSFIPIFDG